MSDNTYNGVCVGGPLDGQRLEETDPVYCHREFTRIPSAPCAGTGVDITVGQQAIYQHIALRFGNDWATFWCYQSLSTFKALEQLFVSYQKAEHAVVRVEDIVHQALVMEHHLEVGINDAKRQVLRQLHDDVSVTVTDTRDGNIHIHAELAVFPKGEAPRITHVRLAKFGDRP